MKEKGIFSSVKIVILTLVFVKLIGFIKQAVVAAYFGTSGSVDKFLLVSEFMENLGVAIFSAIAITFLTLYVEASSVGGKVEGSKLTSNVFVFFLPLVLIVMLVLIVFSQPIGHLIAPGYKGTDHLTISLYIKLFSITVINMFIFYICNAVLEAEKVFFPGKVIGVIRSVCVIGAIVFLSKRFGINSMYIGVITYFFLESGFILFCIRKKVKFKIEKPFRDPRLKKLLKLSLPLFISYGVLQIQGIVDKAIASGLPEGSIASLSYSGYLYNTTHSILIGGLCTVLFSFFTSYVTENKEELLLGTLYKYLRVSIIILIFVTLIFIGYSKEIISIIYERGAFDQYAACNVSIAFCAYSTGFVFIGIRDIMIRTHYAYQNNRAAMVNGIIGVGINIIMSILLSKVLGVTGIALATSIASACIAILSCQTIKKNLPDFRMSILMWFSLKIIGASVITMGCIYLMNRFINIDVLLIEVGVKGFLSLILYFVILRAFRCEEIRDIKDFIMSRLRRR